MYGRQCCAHERYQRNTHSQTCLHGHKPNISNHEAGDCQRTERWKRVKNPVCPGFPSAIAAPGLLQQVCQTHFRHTSGCRTCGEQTHPAIQKANSWCSQHINIVVVEMLRIQQPSKNYFTIFLASWILFLSSMHAPCINTPQHAKYQQFDYSAMQLKHEEELNG